MIRSNNAEVLKCYFIGSEINKIYSNGNLVYERGIDTFEELQELFTNGGAKRLAGNIVCSSALTVSAEEVNLNLNGYNIVLNQNLQIRSSSSFTLSDTSPVSGTISSNTTGFNGGGIYNNGTFTMNGGTISNNTVSNVGGGIFNNNVGTFIMNGGTISGNGAKNGGGVYNLGTLTMNGGTISSNTTSNNCSGVYNVGTFTMNGGTIFGNSAGNGGGGIFNEGTFTMSGGTVSGNTAVNNVGGIFNNGTGTFIMSGGTVSGNTAGGNGGGIFNTGSFTLNDGTISENTANNGGGIYSNNSNTFLYGGTISDNTARSKGGGVSLYRNKSIYVSGSAKIINNTLTDLSSVNNLFSETADFIIVDFAATPVQPEMMIGVTCLIVPTANSPVEVTDYINADYSQYFFSDNQNYHIQYDNNLIWLAI